LSTERREAGKRDCRDVERRSLSLGFVPRRGLRNEKVCMEAIEERRERERGKQRRPHQAASPFPPLLGVFAIV